MAKLEFPYFGKLLVEAIMELDALNVYAIYDNYKFFQMLVPDVAEPFTGTILGRAGEFYGLNLFVGNEGLDMFHLFCEGRPDLTPEQVRKLNLYAYEMLTSTELSDENCKWLKSAGMRLKPGICYPDFSVYKPGKVVTVPNDRDVRVMLYAVNGLLKAIKTGVFEPSDLRDGNDNIFTIKTSGTSIEPRIKILNAPKSKPKLAKPKSLPKSKPQIDLSGYEAQSFEFRSLPRVGGQWAVRAFATLGAVGEDLITLLCIIDIVEGVRQFEVLLGRQPDTAEGVWQALRKSLKEGNLFNLKQYPPSLPDELVFFDAGLYAIANKVFSPLGIRCILGDTNSELYEETERLAEFMNDKFAKGPAKALEEMKRALPKDKFDEIMEKYPDVSESLPDDEDHAAWGELDRRFKKMIFSGFDHDKTFKSKRALEQYFGSLNIYKNINSYDEIFRKYLGLFVVESYCNWFISDYRSTSRSDTVIEKWLVDPKIDIGLLCIIEEFSSGINSFFRLNVKSRKYGRIVLTDMLDPEEKKYEIIDYALAATAKSGLCLPAKVYQLGNFDFYALMGPGLDKFEYDNLMKLYKRANVDTTADEVFDESAYLYGWIWQFYDVLNSSIPGLLGINNDGDPILMHRCVFKVSNAKAVRERLAAISYIDYDKANDRYLWFRPNLLTPTLPGIIDEHRTVLGVLEFKNGNLVVETNSQKRYDKSHNWLDKIEGLSFVKVETT